MPAGDVFGLDGFFLNKSNPVIVSTIGINSTGSSAGIAVTGGSFNDGSFTLNLSNAAGLSTTPFYTGAKIAVSGVGTGYNGTFVVTGFAGTTTVSYATSSYVGTVTTPLSSLTGTLALLVTDTQVTNTTWSSSQTHGWFGGGSSTLTLVSTVDRIDFSNDTGTANIRSPLSLAKFGSAATGNSNYGWFGGGSTPTLVSTVDRIDFSNDSSTASVRGPLSAAKYGHGATGNSNYGWFGGGVGSNSVNRIDFSNDSSTASPRSPLSEIRAYISATGNSNYGWFGGGSITFGPGPVRYSTVYRIDFSNDSSTASVRGPLSLARESSAATGNSNYGWFGGGNPGPLSTVDRINFSNDSSMASPRGSLSLGRTAFAATSGQARSSSTRLQKAGNFGWFGGGYIPTPAVVVTVDRIDFSNDLATASVRGPLSLARHRLAATGNSNYGWFGGGTVYPSIFSTVDRIDFSNDSSTASPRGPLSLARQRLAATGNSNYGWFGGGYVTPAPALLSTVDRIDFSNDSSTASPRGPLSSVRQLLAATGNSNYGWFGGGLNPTPATVSTVDRIDFSNDSSTASPRGPLSLVRYYPAATGNSNYGWFGGGFPTVSTVDRIDFSNDLASASPRGILTQARNSLAATSNTPIG